MNKISFTTRCYLTQYLQFEIHPRKNHKIPVWCNYPSDYRYFFFLALFSLLCSLFFLPLLLAWWQSACFFVFIFPSDDFFCSVYYCSSSVDIICEIKFDLFWSEYVRRQSFTPWYEVICSNWPVFVLSVYKFPFFLNAKSCRDFTPDVTSIVTSINWMENEQTTRGASTSPCFMRMGCSFVFRASLQNLDMVSLFGNIVVYERLV